MSEYLRKLEEMNVSPNFFCSEEYWEKAGWKEYEGCRILTVIDEDKRNVLPVIDLWMDRLYDNGSYWAGFSNVEIVDLSKRKFLDFEFIYRPMDFFFLKGKKWRKVRKNINWAGQDLKEGIFLTEEIEGEDLLAFFISWCEKREGKNWYETDVMAKYVLGGKNRLFLMGMESGKLFGMCIWDENFKYVNFRYCLVKEGIRGLSDLCRVLFYRKIHSYCDKMVNDGGSLGIDSLFKYKKKLNPVEINKIYSLGV